MEQKTSFIVGEEKVNIVCQPSPPRYARLTKLYWVTYNARRDVTAVCLSVDEETVCLEDCSLSLRPSLGVDATDVRGFSSSGCPTTEPKLLFTLI